MAVLDEAYLVESLIIRATLTNAVARKVDLSGANLLLTDLSGAQLCQAKLCVANLTDANLTGADLSGADLSYSTLVDTNLFKATISGSKVFGISAWKVRLDGIKSQSNLRITPDNEPAVYVDNLEVAQFVYLLLHNEKIRSVLDTIGEKGVLILGRFTPERKAVLDAIRNKLRDLGFVPMMFDFEKPTQRDFTETIKTLAGLSRFIIADITNPKSAPLELQATMPDYMVPLVPIIQSGEEPFSMFQDLQNKYEWVLEVREYVSTEEVIEKMEAAIIRPAIQKSEDMLMKRASGIRKKRMSEWS
jgi:uncharacterized protein YjbI with pentapeptide repeats